MSITNLLRVDSSMRVIGSQSRQLTDRVIEHLQGLNPSLNIKVRDLRDAPAAITEQWIAGAFSPPDKRGHEQNQALSESDELVNELLEADVIVIGLPIYNFGVPAAMKAWIDQITRSGISFRYGDNGPIGLLHGKRAIVVVCSGGTKANSEIDFATPYIKHILGFIGIHDVKFVLADKLMADAELSIKNAQKAIATIGN